MATACMASPEVVHRASTIARGPHACPWCGGPTRTDPPVPWRSLRDYLVPCEACDRPICVKVRRERISRRRVTVRLDEGEAWTPEEHVASIIEEPGRRGLWRRALAASSFVVLAFALMRGASGSTGAGGATALLTVLPAAMWGPALTGMLAGLIDRTATPLRQRLRAAPVQLRRGRFDQWAREARWRRAELHADPGAVLAELELVLEPRELRRIREMARRGEVPLARLDDLLRRRRGWTREEREQIAATG